MPTHLFSLSCFLSLFLRLSSVFPCCTLYNFFSYLFLSWSFILSQSVCLSLAFSQVNLLSISQFNFIRIFVKTSNECESASKPNLWNALFLVTLSNIFLECIQFNIRGIVMLLFSRPHLRLVLPLIEGRSLLLPCILERNVK